MKLHARAVVTCRIAHGAPTPTQCVCNQSKADIQLPSTQSELQSLLTHGRRHLPSARSHCSPWQHSGPLQTSSPSQACCSCMCPPQRGTSPAQVQALLSLQWTHCSAWFSSLQCQAVQKAELFRQLMAHNDIQWLCSNVRRAAFWRRAQGSGALCATNRLVQQAVRTLQLMVLTMAFTRPGTAAATATILGCPASSSSLMALMAGKMAECTDSWKLPHSGSTCTHHCNRHKVAACAQCTALSR